MRWWKKSVRLILSTVGYVLLILLTRSKWELPLGYFSAKEADSFSYWSLQLMISRPT